MSDELDIKKKRRDEVIALHEKLGDKLREHDQSNRDRIDEIDEELITADDYEREELLRERDELVEELSETGLEILDNEIEELEKDADR